MYIHVPPKNEGFKAFDINLFFSRSTRTCFDSGVQMLVIRSIISNTRRIVHPTTHLFFEGWMSIRSLAQCPWYWKLLPSISYVVCIEHHFHSLGMRLLLKRGVSDDKVSVTSLKVASERVEAVVARSCNWITLRV